MKEEEKRKEIRLTCFMCLWQTEQGHLDHNAPVHASLRKSQKNAIDA